jgi:outer membrane lipopolysaccharide assembly protein LptE/RlpB
MDDVTDTLRTAFENNEYEVGETSRNRDKIRIAIRDSEASADDLRSITFDAVDEDDVLGFNVTTESVDGGDEVTTVVSFRHRG